MSQSCLLGRSVLTGSRVGARGCFFSDSCGDEPGQGVCEDVQQAIHLLGAPLHPSQLTTHTLRKRNDQSTDITEQEVGRQQRGVWH